MNSLTQYEQEQYNKIIQWENNEPSFLSKTVGFITKPFAWITNKIIPEKAIQGALIGFNSIAKTLTDENDILRDANVSSIHELKVKDLQVSDELANNVHNWAIGIAATEGGVTGSLGLPGIAADIPIIITFALRTIHKIGLCYGYKTTTQEDNLFVYSIMSTVGSNSVKEKNMAIATLKQLNVILVKQTWKKMAEKAVHNKMSGEAFLIAIRELAKQLGINLTKRKALQSIPIVGAGVGTAVNIAFINDICWAARKCYQKRWLIDNDKVKI